MSNTTNTEPFGLKSCYLDEIRQVLSSTPEIDRAMVFGSRAKGSYRRGSDVDIALFGDLNLDQISHIEYQLNEETHIPLFFDVVGYNSLSNPALKDHIDRVGQSLLYTRDPTS